LKAGGGPEASKAAQITSRFRELQGLKVVPVALALLVTAVVTEVIPFSPAEIRKAQLGVMLIGLAVIVAAFASGVIAMRKIGAWYGRKFGSVVPTKRQRRIGAILGGSGAFAIILQFNIESMAATSGQTVPVNLMLFTFALWIVAYWVYLGRFFYHYLALAAAGFALGILSTAGIPPAGFGSHVREAFVYISLAGIIAGVIDHRILSRSLSEPGSPVGLQP
jgi:uncharacterized membrane protein